MHIPDGDVLVHCGDALTEGNYQEFLWFKSWFSRQGHKLKFYVPGNHDIYVDSCSWQAKEALEEVGITLLGLDRPSVTLPNGMTMLGLPYVINLPFWAFNKTEEEIATKLELAGYHDIVAAHSPPKGILDGSHYGTRGLLDYIYTQKPKLVVCGHVHESYGHRSLGHTDVYNVAMCDENYKHVNPPVVIDL